MKMYCREHGEYEAENVNTPCPVGGETCIATNYPVFNAEEWRAAVARLNNLQSGLIQRALADGSLRMLPGGRYLLSALQR